MPPVAEQALPATRPGSQWPLVVLAGAVLLAIGLGRLEGRTALLFAIGTLLGVTLWYTLFGFTGAYYRLFTGGDSRGVRAQLVMVALATLLFAPLLARGEFLGQGLGGAWAPAGVQVAAGAFMFGIGMQLGGGCGSGTLFAAGGGGARQAVTLTAFIAGSFWASLQMGWWQQLPALGTVVLGQSWGWATAAAAQVALLALLWGWLARRDRLRDTSAPGPHHWFAGPWPLLVGALALALLNAATLVTAGHPWSITWAFSLWGAKSAVLLGWDPASSPFWASGFPAWALGRGILDDVTSVMDIGIILGALLAAALAGRFGRDQTVAPARVWVAAIAGGLLMGYGARIAFGCNIGAFFSGVASTSLHGWLWIAAALPGNWVGVRLRPRFGL